MIGAIIGVKVGEDGVGNKTALRHLHHVNNGRVANCRLGFPGRPHGIVFAAAVVTAIAEPAAAAAHECGLIRHCNMNTRTVVLATVQLFVNIKCCDG